jgi:PAS domain S-box-containing protein
MATFFRNHSHRLNGKKSRQAIHRRSKQIKPDPETLITQEQSPGQKFVGYREMIEGLVKMCNDTEIIICLDSNGVILNSSELTARRFNKSMKEFIGTSIWEVLPPEVAAIRKQIFDRVVETRHAIRFEDERVGLWLDSMVYPLYDESGNFTMAIVIGRDISAQKNTEIHIKKENLNLEQMVTERTAILEKFIAELKAKTKKLRDMNATLRVLMDQRDQDRAEFEQNVLNNVENMAQPCLERLMNCKLDSRQQEYVLEVVSNLKNITSPFLHRLSSSMLRLTPHELQVANLIRDGKASKDIAKVLNISLKTVEVYRRQLRNKLDLTDKKTNLRTYLLSFR